MQSVRDSGPGLAPRVGSVTSNDRPEPAGPSEGAEPDGAPTRSASRHQSNADDADVGAPARIGRFTVLGRVGQGAMGLVYAVLDDDLERRVALKVIRGGASGEMRRRLEREAHVLTALNDPHVVPVFEIGRHEGQLFLVMEEVEGPSLRRWVVGGRSVDEIVDKYVQAGRGLAAAHEAGLVHGDFKPDNAIVDGDGRVRVLDFGLVRRDEERGAITANVTEVPKESMVDPGITTTGMTHGTPAYMAAEQFLGDPIDHRSDQFSFCVSLWEALVGERPFAGRSRRELLGNVTRGRLRRASWGGVLPTWLRPILERGLESSPEARWPSMTALLAAIEKGRRPRRWRWFAAAVAFAGSVAIALGALCPGADG